MLDIEILSRIQFALTASFHYIYPPLSIGLGVVMVALEAAWLKTNNIVYYQALRFWVTIFALIFGIGVATGIVMEFEFGTNWAFYSRYVGDIFGSALAAEGLFAFFMESGFLAVLVFGWNKVGKKVHFLSTIMVALGAMFSAVWIVVANSWQQTPTGYEIVGEGLEARAHIVDFWAMVFNPSSVDRLAHVIFGSWAAGAFLVVSIAAFYLIKKQHLEVAKVSMKTGLILGAVAIGMQFVTGHSSALYVAEHQPAKLAAFEGHYVTDKPADLYIAGWVDDAKEKVTGIAIPGMLSFLVNMDFNSTVTGLDQFEEDLRPPVNFVFQTYHLMIAMGMAMAALLAMAGFYWWRGSLFTQRWLLWMLVPSVILPQIANQAGWFTAEVGRQPWIVYGLLRTCQGLSEALTASQVLASLIMFAVIYFVLFILFLFLMNEKIKKGPQSAEKLIEENKALKDFAKGGHYA